MKIEEFIQQHQGTDELAEPINLEFKDLPHLIANLRKKKIIKSTQSIIINGHSQFGKTITAKRNPFFFTKEEAMQEIADIQQQMRDSKSTDPIGYIFTNHAKEGEWSHYEMLMILPDDVIKPVTWGKEIYEEGRDDKRYIRPADFHSDSYTPYLESFFSNIQRYKKVRDFPNLQGSGGGCATLGFLAIEALYLPCNRQINLYMILVCYLSIITNNRLNLC